MSAEAEQTVQVRATINTGLLQEEAVPHTQAETGQAHHMVIPDHIQRLPGEATAVAAVHQDLIAPQEAGLHIAADHHPCREAPIPVVLRPALPLIHQALHPGAPHLVEGDNYLA